ERFAIILTTNLFGDILSDLVAGLTGGLGLAASANVGEPGPAIFEPVHGSAPDIAGRGIANPLATLRAAVLLLRHIEEPDAAHRLDAAIESVIGGVVLTPDLGGTASPDQVVDAVIAGLASPVALGGVR